MNECKKEKRGGICFYNCDNIEFMKTKPDNYYDLAIVDPPYGLERFKKASKETTGVYAKRGSFKSLEGQNWNNEKPSKEYFKELFRVSKNQIIWGANNFELPPSEYFCVWDKQQYMPNFASAEYAWVSMGLKKPAQVFRYAIHKENAIRKAQGGKIHQAQKPVDLYRWILQIYAKAGFKILDTHGGSHTNAIACDMEGFELDIIEIDEKYFNDGLKAYDMHKRQTTLF